MREVAESHGGRVFAHNRPGGGAEIGFTLRTDPVDPGAGSVPPSKAATRAERKVLATRRPTNRTKG